jgi:tRNA/tmRNA/rRNA uracil-C5-methylase (TrmA/RlmC/RlmD family)
VDTDALAALAQLAEATGAPPPQGHAGAQVGWRHRARLAIRGRVHSPKVGIFQTASHRIVDIPRCLVHHPLINEVAAQVKQALRAAGVAPYRDATHAGVARYLQVVVERASQSAQVVLVSKDESPAAIAPVAERLKDALGDSLHSLWWNGNPLRHNTILGPAWQKLSGPDTICETVAGADIHFPPGAFGQANLDLADRMVELIRGWVPEGARVLDLYAGCGAIGLPMLARAGELLVNERGADSLAGLRRSIDALAPDEASRTRLLPGDAADVFPLTGGEAPPDVVIADPPRKGLEARLCKALAEQPPATLVYVSCGLPAFLQQARVLLNGGRLRLARIEAFALIPHTGHVETVARFERI